MQHVVGHQLAISEPTSVLRDHRARFGPQAIGGDIEPLRRLREQERPYLGRGVLDGHATIVH
jgi:hypothetical protein